MSRLRDLYAGVMGYDPKSLERSSWYLAELSVGVALEIDRFARGRNNNFSHTEELADILGGYQSEGEDTPSGFPYWPLVRTIRASNKNIRTVSELTLEVRSLKEELESVQHLPKKRLEYLRNFMVELSKQFSAEGRHLRRRMVS
ncbi:MAG: hypothetical protein AABW87_03305 [Nanoarchaeota archaeon]